jgi:hypothetical protein
MRRRNRRKASKGRASLVRSKFTKKNARKVKSKKANPALTVNVFLWKRSPILILPKVQDVNNIFYI